MLFSLLARIRMSSASVHKQLPGTNLPPMLKMKSFSLSKGLLSSLTWLGRLVERPHLCGQSCFSRCRPLAAEGAYSGTLTSEDGCPPAVMGAGARSFYCRLEGESGATVKAGCDEGQSGVWVLDPESAQCRGHNNVRRTQQHSCIYDVHP